MDPDGPGLLATAGAAVEREVVEIEPCCANKPVALAGMHARLGGGGHWFGLKAGALAFQGWRSSDLSTPAWAVFPELKISIGPPTLHGVLGFGSDLPTTLRRPAFLYTGAGANFDWGGFDVRGGFNRAGPALLDDFAARLDVVMRLRIVPDVFIVPGARCKLPTRGRSSDGKARWPCRSVSRRLPRRPILDDTGHRHPLASPRPGGIQLRFATAQPCSLRSPISHVVHVGDAGVWFPWYEALLMIMSWSSVWLIAVVKW